MIATIQKVKLSNDVSIFNPETYCYQIFISGRHTANCYTIESAQRYCRERHLDYDVHDPSLMVGSEYSK